MPRPASLVVLLCAAAAVVAAVGVLAHRQGRFEVPAALRTVFGDAGPSRLRAPQTLQVIGAGLGRTGTESMRMALDRLGYHTYHMFRNVQERHSPLWAAVGDDVHGGLTGAAADAVIDAMEAAGYNATVDLPACLLFERMLQRNPDARVLLTVRSSTEVWVRSFIRTIGNMCVSGALGAPPMTYLIPGAGAMHAWINDVLGLRGLADPSGGRFPSYAPDAPDVAGAAYEAWNDRVRRVVPADQLLEYQPGDGWAPLCRFLDVPDADCPTDSYPRSNDSASMQRVITAVLTITRWWWVVGPLLLLAAAAAVVGVGKLASSVGRAAVRRCCGSAGKAKVE